METTDLQLFKQTVVLDENNDIFIQPLCDFFGINYNNQRNSIVNDPILSTSHRKNDAKILFGDNRKRVCLDKNGFLRWIQLLNPKIVKPELKDKLIQYQKNIYSYITGDTLVPLKKAEFELEVELRHWNKVLDGVQDKRKEIKKKLSDIRQHGYVQLGLQFPEGLEKPVAIQPFFRKSHDLLCEETIEQTEND